jgi:hypothetical protein
MITILRFFSADVIADEVKCLEVLPLLKLIDDWKEDDVVCLRAIVVR